MQPPENYTYQDFYEVGSNVSRIQQLVCLKCGNVVGNAYQHDSWHAMLDATLDFICPRDAYSKQWHMTVQEGQTLTYAERIECDFFKHI